jgi:trehalose-phosphatase
MPPSPGFDSAIFDLDGVITDTARLHAAAWKELIDGYLTRRNEEHAPFNLEQDYRRYVDGKPRYDGLQSFLVSRAIRLPWGEPSDPADRETICGLANGKDRIFHRVLDSDGVDLIPGTIRLVQELRSAGIRVAVASSSRNCQHILDRAGVSDLFEARVDGETLAEAKMEGKPAPDMFLEAAARVGARPAFSVVFEDAVSGVEAGVRGKFGLVVGVAPDESAWSDLRVAGADLVWLQTEMEELHADLLTTWFSAREHRRPSALTHWPEIGDRLSGARPVVFLDFDGTLAPIVSRPDDAAISADTRKVVKQVAQRFPTTVVSGRGRDDVARRVGLPELHYAGSHGFDIQGPRGPDSPMGSDGVLEHRVATEIEPLIEEATREVETALAQVEGVVVEPKGFTVAVHYRMVAEGDLAQVESVVSGTVEARPELRLAHGKKVYEIRPELDWDKGKAVLWLLEALGLSGPEVLPLYLGDDVTDEDAFRALGTRGVGILVSTAPRPSAANYQLQDPREVTAFLEKLLELEAVNDGVGQPETN